MPHDNVLPLPGALPTYRVVFRSRSDRTSRQTGMMNLALDLQQDANHLRGEEGGVLSAEARILEALAERNPAAVTEAVRHWLFVLRAIGERGA